MGSYYLFIYISLYSPSVYIIYSPHSFCICLPFCSTYIHVYLHVFTFLSFLLRTLGIHCHPLSARKEACSLIKGNTWIVNLSTNTLYRCYCNTCYIFLSQTSKNFV